MRIGFDVDGVLANFIPTYQRLIVKTAERNLFQPDDHKNPPCWLWPEYRGYTKPEISTVWKIILASEDFWLGLAETADCSTLRLAVLDLERWHDVYYVTSRPGKDAKWQTEQWLMLHLGVERPTVLISKEKGLVAKALNLDCYLDDNIENANDVARQTDLGGDMVEVSSCRSYLLDRSYNQSKGPGNPAQDPRVIRVKTLGAFLDAELVNL